MRDNVLQRISTTEHKILEAILQHRNSYCISLTNQTLYGLKSGIISIWVRGINSVFQRWNSGHFSRKVPSYLIFLFEWHTTFHHLKNSYQSMKLLENSVSNENMHKACGQVYDADNADQGQTGKRSAKQSPHLRNWHRGKS